MNTSTVATATAAVTPAEIADAASGLMHAFESHNWALIAAAILSALVIIGRLVLKAEINKKYIPWIAMFIAVASSVAAGLKTGKAWMSIAVTGVLVGVAAVGGWETFGKLLRGILRKLRGSKEAEPAERAETKPEKPAEEDGGE
jgi:hypothetical protein